MNTKVLFLIAIATIIACTKIADSVQKDYTDKELNINSESDYAEKERHIKLNIMNFHPLSKNDRMKIVKGISIENGKVSGIINNTMPIFKKLKINDLTELYKIILPNVGFKIIDNNNLIIDYQPNWKECDYYISYWYKRNINCLQPGGCNQPGENQCFCYVPCN